MQTATPNYCKWCQSPLKTHLHYYVGGIGPLCGKCFGIAEREGGDRKRIEALEAENERLRGILAQIRDHRAVDTDWMPGPGSSVIREEAMAYRDLKVMARAALPEGDEGEDINEFGYDRFSPEAGAGFRPRDDGAKEGE